MIVAQRQPGKLTINHRGNQLGNRPKTVTGANAPPVKKLKKSKTLLEEMLVARSHTKIEKVTLDDLKLTAIFSKRRKIGAS